MTPRLRKAVGLLSAEAIQEILRRRLLLWAGESLREIHRRMPDKELPPQSEQEITAAVQGYQVQRHGGRSEWWFRQPVKTVMMPPAHPTRNAAL